MGQEVPQCDGSLVQCCVMLEEGMLITLNIQRAVVWEKKVLMVGQRNVGG